MKFVFVAPRFHTNQYEIVKTLQNNGHEVEFNVVEIGHTEDHTLLMPKLYEPCFLSKLAIKLSTKDNIFMYKSFPNPFKYFFELKNTKANFIILRDPNKYFSLLNLIIARIIGIKIIFYTQTDLYKKYTLKNKILRSMLLKFFNAAWMTPLEGNIDKYNNHPKHMYFVPFAVPQWFNSISKVIELPKLLMIGKFQERKNYLLFLKAISFLKEKYDFRVTLIGECMNSKQKEELDKVEKFIKDNNLEKIVEIKLNIPFNLIKDYYKEHDCFILPSKNEPASISLLEAMACGLPVICSTTCGTKSYIKEGINGFIFESDNLESLIEKIETCINDTEKLSKMKENSFLHSKKTITGEAYYKALSNMIFDKWKIKI